MTTYQLLDSDDGETITLNAGPAFVWANAHDEPLVDLAEYFPGQVPNPKLLPSSGRLTLNDIKSEFNKSTNLKSYYGVASGIPSSGTIKITDFYGKAAGGGGSPPPSGSSPNVLDLAAPNYTMTANTTTGYQVRITYRGGTGGGSNFPFTGTFGVGTISNSFDLGPFYPTSIGTAHDPVQAVEYYNQYRNIQVGTSKYSGPKYNCLGKWGYYEVSGAYFIECNQVDAGAEIKRILGTGNKLHIQLTDPT